MEQENDGKGDQERRDQREAQAPGGRRLRPIAPAPSQHAPPWGHPQQRARQMMATTLDPAPLLMVMRAAQPFMAGQRYYMDPRMVAMAPWLARPPPAPHASSGVAPWPLPPGTQGAQGAQGAQGMHGATPTYGLWPQHPLGPGWGGVPPRGSAPTSASSPYAAWSAPTSASAAGSDAAGTGTGTGTGT
eukprot:CAMPEP_0196778358 /NCGR_PEP_ID=MMETSP1104-20130614/5755_1 /TAXON_ID=33652 /ORGANISM="Cafeteria sp., Strain Caron Lab Isolate" /LENGTH=187 /DNA_ID=CAMNT_0042148527 /DNA_START=66 /DNA_END=626 /DNA_ORIENTATION=+